MHRTELPLAEPSAGLDWWRDAACQTVDPDLFFPVSSLGPGRDEVARAKAVCARCPVRRQCLQFALATRQAHGVWGGTTEEERRLRVPSQQRKRRSVTGEPATDGRSRASRLRDGRFPGYGTAATRRTVTGAGTGSIPGSTGKVTARYVPGGSGGMPPSGRHARAPGGTGRCGAQLP